ncbi:sodium/proton antiporter, NhaA family [Paramicrobacterium humi]|uniref:Na(+)/H(+) antiporter NhaA n=1 Tax=Paramicrobacterium humi TaxID=640635 RepID=A0A1H4INF0_9MICO|nr:Na+/H+ antiporter NhaA [Microbacterium humi]SEB35493.1 sodium/proton antiporter, NhaA family [Microbacterium humi]
MTANRTGRTVLGRGSFTEAKRIGELLRTETVGGSLLVVAAIIAIVWANSPWADGYFAVRDITIGYAPLHLELTIGEWASDGLLAIFFFLTGLELKKEFVAGDLRSPATALVPVAAAFGGVAVPAIIYTLINLGSDRLHGWAIPTATDIAFAVAVLAIIGSSLPSALRIFLLTLAVVDDLIAIVIIAIFYAQGVEWAPLLLTLIPVAVYAFLTHAFPRFFRRRKWAAWAILLPIGLVAWALLHASGIHATIAGVALGFCVPVLRSRKHGGPEAGPGLAEVLEHRLRPLSTGFAVPVFAFFAAGVAIGGPEGFLEALTDPVMIGITAGLVLGKPIGITLTTWVLTRFTKARLDDSLAWIDVIGMGLLGGIGFTVSLLVAELSFAHPSPHIDHAKIAIFTASVLAALLATVVLRIRNRHYRLIAEQETVDADENGVPDVYEKRDDS